MPSVPYRPCGQHRSVGIGRCGLGRRADRGTYIHGIFDDDHFRRAVLNRLRVRRGMGELPIQYRCGAEKEHAYDRLAATVQRSLDMDKLATIIAAGES